MSAQDRPKTFTRRWLLVPVIAVALVVAYALAGFMLVPWVAGRELPRFIEETLQHRARIGEIRFNPFTLRLQAREFALETSAGRPVLGFSDAIIGLRWNSLQRRAWVLDEVRLVDPVVHIEIGKDGRLNLAALVPNTAGTEATPAGAGSTAAAQFAIGHFSVTNGSIAFEDRRQGYRNRAERLSIELASLSTLDPEMGPYALTGQTPGGAKLKWKGELSLAPLVATGTLSVANAALAELMPYIDDFTAARILAGRADLELPYRWALAGGKLQFSIKGAKLNLRELALASAEETALLTKFGAIALGGVDFDLDKQQVLVKTLRIGESIVSRAQDKMQIASAGPIALDGVEFTPGSGRGSVQQLAIARLILAAGDESRPLALLRQFALDGIEFDLPTQRVSARGLRVPELSLALARDANGELDLLRLFPARGKVAEAKVAEWQASIAKVELGNVSARYTDATAKTPLALALQGLSGSFGFDAASAGEDTRFRLDGGSFALEKLEALAASASPGSAPQPAMKLAKLALDGIEFDLSTQRLSAKGLMVPELSLALARDANGELDLLRLFPARGKVAGAKQAEWQASVGKVKLGNVSARYTDATAKTPLALALQGLSSSFAFDAASAGEDARFRLDGGSFALEKLEALAASASPDSAPQPAMRLAKLALEAARYDSGANAVEAAALRIGSFGVDTVLDKGRLSLLDLLPAAGKTKAGKPISAQVKMVELSEGGINFTDSDRGIAVALERLALKLSDVSTDSAKPLSFDLAADVKSGGRIALRGRAVPAQDTVEAKIELIGVALAPTQPVLTQFASVKFSSGDLSLSGMLSAGGKNAKLAYSGSASIANLALDDTAGERLFGWKSLATESLKATLSPDRIDIDELRLIAPAGRFARAKDGTSNISRAFTQTQTAAGESKPAPAGAGETKPAPVEAGAARADEQAAAPEGKADAQKPGTAGSFAVAVRRVRIDQGALDFSDASISPGFVAKIYDLAGTANGLSSNHDARSQFSLEGRVDEFGYARLSGAVNPFAPRNRSTFRVQLRNIDLVTATPYSMRFAGYRIATGRLGMDLNYRVRESLIEGDNKITLEQFTLGEHVDSPDAIKLPFELAVSLLKDPDGTISLEVPVKGNLDDPQFSLAPLIWEAVGNFIGNIVTAPFRALAHLFGGNSGEDLGAIAFNPGSVKLLPPEREKLIRVVDALAKHPELKLIIPAHYDSEADARAMKRAALNREISRRAGFAVAEDEEPGPVNIEDRATRKALRTMFVERFSKDELDRIRAEAEAKSLAAGQPAPSLTTRLRNFASGEPQLVDTREFHQTLLRRLRESQALAADALVQLAEQRGLAIEAALKAAGTDAARIARTLAEPSADAEAKQVTVRLSLAAR